MNVVGPRWGQNILAYGPGDARLDHTPQEHIRIDEYRVGIDVLSAVLQAQQGVFREPTLHTQLLLRSQALGSEEGETLV